MCGVGSVSVWSVWSGAECVEWSVSVWSGECVECECGEWGVCGV